MSTNEAPTTDPSEKKKNIMKIVGIVVIALLVVFLFYFFVIKGGSLNWGAKEAASTGTGGKTGN